MNEVKLIAENDWVGYRYCLKKHEFIDFYEVIKGFDSSYEITNIRKIVESVLN